MSVRGELTGLQQEIEVSGVENTTRNCTVFYHAAVCNLTSLKSKMKGRKMGSIPFLFLLPVLYFLNLKS